MLKEGDKVPAALLKASFDVSYAGASEGKPASLGDLAPAGQTLVLFFYPKDSTPGCTREAQGFTAAKKAIEKAGAAVVGVSRDSVKSHGSFRDKYQLSIPLISDPERKLHEGFGAWGEKVMYGKKVLGAIRSTFFIKDGKVTKVWPSVKVDSHIDQVLEALSAERAEPSLDASRRRALSGGAESTPAKAGAKAKSKA